MTNQTYKKTFLGLAGAAVLFAACSKNEDISLDPQNNLAGASVLQTECPTEFNNYLGPNGPFPPKPAYELWTSGSFDFGYGTPVVQTEGMFNSFFRPSTEHWYIGTIEWKDTCKTWYEIKGIIQVKNRPENLGTDPNTDVSQGPYNVVGVHGETEDPEGYYGLGYYLYDEDARTASPERAIVIWKDESPAEGTWPTAVSDPSDDDADISEAYLIVPQKITAIVGPGPQVKGNIPFTWKQYSFEE